MRFILILCMVLVPTIACAEDYTIRDSYNTPMGSIDCGSDCSIRNIYGEEVGRLESDSLYAPNYMPELGTREGTDITIHLPSNEEMMK